MAALKVRGIAVVVLLGGVAGLVLWLAGDGRGTRGSSGLGRDGEQDAAPGERVDGSLGRPAASRSGERRSADARATPEEETNHRASGPEPTPPPRRMGPLPPRAEWIACLADPDPARVRVCLEAQLDGQLPGPEELATMVCQGAPPDAAARLLMGIVARQWPPTELAADVIAFQRGCDNPSSYWARFVREAAGEDPLFRDAFAASLTPEVLTAADDLAVLGMAAELAADGDASLRAMVESIALSSSTPSDAQVAFAFERALGWQGTPEQRLAFVRDVLSAPAFAGGPAATHGAFTALFSEPIVSSDPEASTELALALLSSPSTSAASAREILDRERFGTWPPGFPAALRERLVQAAQP